jgi:putative colanic acid biosysnthesis UDP-glucose lipid carrier transferase
MYSFNSNNLSEQQKEDFSEDFTAPELEDEFIENRKSHPRRNGAAIFRFLFLIVDVTSLNIAPIILLSLMRRVHYSLDYFFLLIGVNVLWIISAYATALYFASDKFVKRTVYTFAIYFTALLLFLFLYNYNYSRLFIILSVSGFAFSLTVTRTISIGTAYYLKSGNRFTKKVIVLGVNNVAEKLAETFRTKGDTYKVYGYFNDDYVSSSRYPVLGNIEGSVAFAMKNGIDEIYSTIMPEHNSKVYELALEAERNFIRFRFVPDFSLFINRQCHVNFLNETPIFSLRPEPLQEMRNQMKKRVFDVVFSSIVIILVLSWLVPIVAILIKLDSKGPVFFKQLRSGKNNLKFLCFKFRSLHVNAEADSKQVVRRDTRFTRIGRFLRKTNIDELPQFFNVLKGDMSIVGPRPHMLKHTEEYSTILNQYMVRHFVKPGITGLAQISGFRGEIKKHEQLHKRVEYDILYMENWSMWQDLKIIMLTVYITFKGDKNAF